MSPADVLTGERGRSNGNNSDYYDDDLYYDESDEEDDDDDYESEKSSNVTESAGANLAMPPMTDKKNLFDDKKDSFDGDYPEESDKMTPFIDDDIPATGKQSDTVKRYVFFFLVKREQMFSLSRFAVVFLSLLFIAD